MTGGARDPGGVEVFSGFGKGLILKPGADGVLVADVWRKPGSATDLLQLARAIRKVVPNGEDPLCKLAHENA